MTDEIRITVKDFKLIEFYQIPGKDLENATPEHLEQIRAAKDPIGEAMRLGYNVSVCNPAGTASVQIEERTP